MASTSDHVFAKQFFLENRRANLPQVPACAFCNGRKSHLEHYLASVMPFGGLHSDAMSNLSEMVPARLEKNARLQRLLSQGKTRTWAKHVTGLYLPVMVLPFDSEKLSELFVYITKALSWLHWQTRLTDDDFVDAIHLSGAGEKYFKRLMSQRANDRIENDLGEGTFAYKGSQGVDNPKVAVWEFSIYGGLHLAGDPDVPTESSSKIGVLTGPRRIAKSAELKLKWLSGNGTVR